MFGRSKPVLFQPYGRRRGARVPRWLVLLLVGALAGAAGVLFVQWHYLPPRLSAEEAAALRSDFERADVQRRQLGGELADATKKLDAALAERARLGAELATNRATTARLGDDLAAVVDALPSDPRSGRVEVRAARFVVRGGELGYQLVLSRERAAPRALTGVLQFVVEGASARGTAAGFTTEPIAVSVDSHAVVRGRVALPEGFKPRQSTIRVLDQAGGKLLGSRVMLVK
ncbi:MAG TPA: hypothetical protein VNU71_07710 [Burkholderiaceae bacterium]|nr:hypothetical protein [Burkholderiaceae bacterium]